MPTKMDYQGRGNDYERMTGGSPHRVIREMLSLATATHPITPSSYILDNACGPGVVSSIVIADHPSVKIKCTDFTPSMIDQVKARGWKNVDAEIMDMRDLKGLQDETFTHVFTNFGIQAVPEVDSPLRACKEIYRVMSEGGVCMVSTWADRGFVPPFAAVHASIRPNGPAWGMLGLPNWDRGSFLMGVLEDAGFGSNVMVKPFDSYISADSLDELTELEMLAAKMFWNEWTPEELEKAKPVMKVELAKAPMYRVVDGKPRIMMRAWIGIAWK